MEKRTPQKVLRKLLADNPQMSESESLARFIDIIKKDTDLTRQIIEEMFKELGVEGVQTLLNPTKRH